MYSIDMNSQIHKTMDMTKQHTSMEVLWKIAVLLNNQTEPTKHIIRMMHYQNELEATKKMLDALQAFEVRQWNDHGVH